MPPVTLPQSQLTIHLFGLPRIIISGQEIQVSSNKARALLFYIAVENRLISRQTLLALFWPDSPVDSAQSSLRNQLTLLRKDLSPFLNVTRSTVQLNAESYIVTDVNILNEAVREDSTIESAKRAIDFCQGEFLAGFFVRRAPSFEQWVIYQQTIQSGRLRLLLERLNRHYFSIGEYDSAVTYSNKYVANEPLADSANFQRMLALGLTGQCSAALSHYASWQKLLWSSIGAKPAAYVEELIEPLRNGDMGKLHSILDDTFPPQEVSKEPRLDSSAEQHDYSTSTLTEPSKALVPPVTQTQKYNVPFVGRVDETQSTLGYLNHSSYNQFVTLYGPGGIGKTRLALHIGDKFSHEHAHSNLHESQVFVVNLNGVDSLPGIIGRIAAALGIEQNIDTLSEGSLFDSLNQKAALLILDGFEHIVSHSSLISRLLDHVTNVKLLVTSRIPLRIANERLVQLSGLPLLDPARIESLSYRTVESRREYQTALPTEHSGAIDCFCRYAEFTNADFTYENDWQSVNRICQLVDGMPLALMEVASWTNSISLKKCVEILEDSYETIYQKNGLGAQTEQTLESIANYSWNLLSEEMRSIAARLAIIPDCFELNDGYYVAGLKQEHLKEFINTSWLQLMPNGDYKFYEVLRRFALQLLDPTSPEYDQLRCRYVQYYSELANKIVQQLSQSAAEALAMASRRFLPLRTAWIYALEGKDSRSLISLTEFIWLFCDHSDRLQEGYDLFDRAVVGINSIWLAEENALTQDEQDFLLNIVETGRRCYAYRLGNYEEVEIIAGRLEQLSACRTHPLLGTPPYINTAGLALRKSSLQLAQGGRVVDAIAFCEESQLIYAQLGNTLGKVACRYTLGRLEFIRGALDDSIHYLNSAIAGSSQMDAQAFMWQSQMLLARIAILRGNYGEAGYLLGLCKHVADSTIEQAFHAKARLWLAHLANLNGEHDVALLYLDEGQSYVARSRDRDGLATLILERGATYRLMGDYETATNTLLQLLERTLPKGTKFVLADIYEQLGMVYCATEEFTQAEHYFTMALNFHQGNNELATAPLLGNLGYARLHIGGLDLNETRDMLRSALATSVKLTTESISMRILIGIAKLATELGRNRDAIDLLTWLTNSPTASVPTRQHAAVHLSQLRQNDTSDPEMHREEPAEVNDSRAQEPQGWLRVAESILGVRDLS